MTHPIYIREKAIQMRVERQMSIDEIAERLALPKTTIFYWVKDIPLQRVRRTTKGQRMRNKGNALRYRLLREAAYHEGQAMYDELILEPTFRDFVCMYIGEGFKRNRNTVAICNSDPAVIVLSEAWIRRFAQNKIDYTLQFHADQDPDELREFWGNLLGIDPGSVRLQRKSNSNQLRKRTWRSRHGVLTIRVGDTYFRAKLQAWIDRVHDEWLDWQRFGA